MTHQEYIKDTMEARQFHPGMGQAVAERTILRKDPDGKYETWADVARRVAFGNALLCDREKEDLEAEFEKMHEHLRKVNLLMSGRHLQHGDADQPNRTMEVFTNCGHRGTEFITADRGVCKLGDVVGETVVVKTADGKWRPAEVKKYGRQRLYNLTFRRVGAGPAVHQYGKFTRNHRWLLEDGTATDDIQVGDVLAMPEMHDERDKEAIQHGLIFGDGSNHKSRHDYPGRIVSQGREYCAIRLCGEDKKYLKHFEGCRVSYPPHAEGDPVVYVGKKVGWKSLPFCSDPSYIAGFIHGWWLADGAKGTGPGTIEISTCREDAAEWLKQHAAYIGGSVVGHRIRERKEGDGSYANGKSLHIIRISLQAKYRLESIEPLTVEDVYCVEEPETQSFVLANGLLTGNCSSSSSSFMLFYLLMSGSGVGRCYDDDLMLANWDNAPNVLCVLDESHPDFDFNHHHSLREAQHRFGRSDNVIWFDVPDSREGWAKAVEVWETLAYEAVHKDKILILNFSNVRAKGTPIGGMQGRPASGPGPLMYAFEKAASIKGASLDPWFQAMHVDHCFAECVLVGGARRAARMSVKFWKDRNVIDFINVKRPIEYYGKTLEEVIEIRKTLKPLSFLWSSNNSILVDEEFWTLLALQPNDEGYHSELANHARHVFKAASEAAYADGTGEPGFINVDKLVQNQEGFEEILKGDYVGSEKYQVEDVTHTYLKHMARVTKGKAYYTIVNPCSEIAFILLGAFCVIADLVPFFGDTLDEIEDAFRTAARALIRVNTMDSVYKKEVQRTNRIGVAITGIHEFAWKFFGHNFHDLIDEEKSKDFWLTMSRFARAVEDEARTYCQIHNLPFPHTLRTIKPSGTVSKLWGLTEGWHLPSMAWYLRWVQFSESDPLVETYAKAGYPTRKLKQYKNTIIVGFPTKLAICDLMPADKIVYAGEATPEEQYQWLKLGEKYWIECVNEDESPRPNRGNQISYTLKYDPSKVSFEEFAKTLREQQSQVRCCSVMPQEDSSAYEYLPEEPISKEMYDLIVQRIEDAKTQEEVLDLVEDIGKEHLDCATGACPIDFKRDK